MPPLSPKNIIVRMPNWLGDLVMATPILADVRKQWPDAHITAMCQGNVGALLEHDSNIDELYRFKKPSGWIHQDQHSLIVDSIRHGNYDLGILLTNSFSSAWWFWRGNVQQRVGFKGNFRNFLLTQAVPFPEQKETQHLVLTYKALLEPLGIPLSQTDPYLMITPEEMQAAHALLAKLGVVPGKQIIVGMNPGAAYGSAKCWLPERFQEVTQSLLQNPQVVVVYFGDPAGASLVHEICKNLPDRVINLAAKTTLRELLALINCCSIFLTNDSGPMHIAAALKIPLLALFGSTSDVKTGPYGGGTVIHKHVECSPCYKRVCPIDFRCMKQIGVQEVYENLKNMIDNPRKN